MFGPLVIAYLFLGGVGGGALAIAGACGLYGFVRQPRKSARVAALGIGLLPSDRSSGFAAARRQSADPFAPFREWAGIMWLVCLATLALGCFCLAVELGRFDRALLLLLRPAPSAISVGFFSLMVGMACCLVAAVSSFAQTRIPKGVFVASYAVAFVSGLVIAAYTGVLLYGMPSVTLWRSVFLPLLFVLSALSCGYGLLRVLFALLGNACIDEPAFVRWADNALMVLEVLVLAGLLLTGWLDVSAHCSVAALLAGDLSWAFWTGAVACGLVLPLALGCTNIVQNYQLRAFAAGLLVLAGGFALRWCLVGAGDFDLSQSAAYVSGMIFFGQ